jgi:hypothetical protein
MRLTHSAPGQTPDMSTHGTHPGAPPAQERRFERIPETDRRAPGTLAEDPRVSGVRGWRADVAVASGLNVLAGVWLIIAPFVLGYRSGDPYWNDIVFGAIVAVVALVRISGAYRASELSWANAIIGAWLFVSAFWLDATGRASWNDVIMGIIVFVLAIASARASEDAALAEVREDRR